MFPQLSHHCSWKTTISYKKKTCHTHAGSVGSLMSHPTARLPCAKPLSLSMTSQPHWADPDNQAAKINVPASSYLLKQNFPENKDILN